VAAALGAGHALLGLHSRGFRRVAAATLRPPAPAVARVARDRAKAAALGAAIGLAGVESSTPAARERRSGARGRRLASPSLSRHRRVPIWILPMFFRLTPLADTTLRTRLLALAERPA